MVTNDDFRLASENARLRERLAVSERERGALARLRVRRAGTGWDASIGGGVYRFATEAEAVAAVLAAVRKAAGMEG